MRFVYPYVSEREGESTVVWFPDVPGAVTQVDRSEDFDETIKDCLVAALGGYIERHRAPPLPGPARSRPTVALDVLTSAKLALALAMSRAEMSNVALAERLGVDEKSVRRLRDLDHVSRIDRIESALAYFGMQPELSIRLTSSALF